MPRFVFLLLAFAGSNVYAGPPLPADKLVTRIAFGSCADQNKPCPIWSTIAAQKPDVLLLLGDTIYADLEGGKPVDPEPAKIARCYADLNKVEAFAALKSSVPILATWDDHDYGKNDAGVEWKHKEFSQKVLLDFLDVPANDPRRSRKGIYHSAIAGPIGQRVQIIMLDNRFFLTVPPKGPRKQFPGYSGQIAPYIPTSEPGMTILGDDQWAWLKEQLLQPAEVRILCSGIQVLPDEHPFEKWANIPTERQKLFDLISETKAGGVVLLSGDRHLGEILVKTDAISYPLFECTASGFNQGSKNWRPPEKSQYRIGGMPYGDHFGTLLIDWNQANPKLTMQLRDEAGDVQIAHSFRLGMLQPKQERKGATAQRPKDGSNLPDGFITPEEALKGKPGDEVKVQFTVAGGRAVSMGKRILLNSEKDFQSETNFTVAVNEKAMTGKYDKATYDTFKGKTIRVKGKLSTFQDRLQIQVDDAGSLEIVESKPKE